jgi:hypothetical protein
MQILFIIFIVIFSYGQTILVNNGPEHNRIVFSFMPEGYTAELQPTFNNLMDSLVERSFRFEPFKTYSKFFNINRFNIESVDSGITDLYSGVTKNTFFGVTIYTSRLSIQQPVPNRVQSIVDNAGIKNDVAVIVANYERVDAGVASEIICITSASRCDYSLIHEAGHCFGDLADEYIAYPGAIKAPNITKDTIRDQIKWKAWIPQNATLPATLGSYYVGAYRIYGYPGYFSPENDCMMKSAQNTFCRICTEAIVLQIHKKVKMYDTTYPAKGTVNYLTSEIPFSLQMVDTTKLKFDVKWYLNDTEISNSRGFSYILDPITSNLGTGSHSLKCKFKDITSYYFGKVGYDSIDYCPFVRTDPDSIMTDSVVWNLVYGTATELASNSLPPQTLTASITSNGIRIAANPFGQYAITVHDIRGRLLANIDKGSSMRNVVQMYRPAASGLVVVRMITSKGAHAAKVVWVR